jgi:type IV pilus assembly protein PilZ
VRLAFVYDGLIVIELRRHSRVPLDTKVVFMAKGGAEHLAGVGTDISVGGMFVRTERVLPFGAELVIHVTLPDQVEELVLPGVVRWQRPDGMGIQFGLLGARETHAITEYVATKSR